MAASERRFSLSKLSVPAFVIAIVLATCASAATFLYGLDHLVSGPMGYLVFALLLLVYAPLLYLLIDRLVLPNLRKIELPGQRWLFVTLTVGAGTYIWWQNPIDLAAEVTVCLGQPSLSLILAVFLAAMLGGLVLLTVLLLGVGIDDEAPHSFYLVSSLIVVYLLVGVTVFDDYSLSPDARVQQRHGQVAWANLAPDLFGYLADEPLAEYDLRYYGVAQHLPLVVVEEFNALDDQQSFQLRNYFTFLLVSLGVFAMYRLAKEGYKDWRLGLVAAALFVLNPRLFAHSLINIKDSLFASMFAVALYFGFRYWRTRSWRFALLFAVTVAFATTIRFIALGLLLVIVIVVAFDLLTTQQLHRDVGQYGVLAGVVVVFYLAYVLMSPAAYPTPFTYLFDTVVFFSDYQGWDKEIMYLGLWTLGRNPPWHFLPVWMVITLPIWTMCLAVCGGLRMGADLLRLKLLHAVEREPFIYLGLLLVPIAAGILQGSTLYNGWRQIYFVYVPLVLIATYGLSALYQLIVTLVANPRVRTYLQIGLTALFILTQASVARWMVVNHPFQTVYFNPLVELDAFGGREAFERDYWFLSVRQGIEYILDNDPREDIKIAPFTYARDGLLMSEHPEKDRAQPVQTADPDADYFIQTYRWPWEIEVERPEVYTIYVDGLAIMTVQTVEAE